MQRATKESKRVIFGTLAFIVLMAVGVSSALADSATYTLGHAETGYGLASDTGPYATVSVSLAGTVATVTFNSQNNGVYSYLFYDGGAAVLNVQGAFSVTGLAYQSANSPGLSGASGFTDPLALTCQSPSGPIPGTPTCVNGSGGEDSLNDSFSLAIYDKTNGHDTPPGGQGGSGNENYGLSQITVTLSGTWASASQVLGQPPRMGSWLVLTWRPVRTVTANQSILTRGRTRVTRTLLNRVPRLSSSVGYSGWGWWVSGDDF